MADAVCVKGYFQFPQNIVSLKIGPANYFQTLNVLKYNPEITLFIIRTLFITRISAVVTASTTNYAIYVRREFKVSKYH